MPAADREDRVDKAIELLCRYTGGKRVAALLSDYFSVSEAEAESYIVEAREVLSKSAAESREDRKARVRDFLWRIARAAHSVGDFNPAIQAARALMRLDALDEPLQIEAKVSAMPFDVSKLSDQQLAELEQKLLELGSIVDISGE